MIDSVGIYRKAEELIDRCDTRDAAQIAREIGIKVLYHDFDTLLGLYTYRWRNRIIILNDGLSYHTEQLVTAHEIGHDRMHRALAQNNEFKEFGLLNIKDITEYEANAFAAHLLLSNDEVLNLIRQVNDLSKAAQLLCVNPNLLLIKVREMNKLGYEIPLSVEYDRDFFNNMPEFI